MEHVFAAPRELVFRNWVEPELLGAWFAPAGFDVTSCRFEARLGGRWRIEFSSPGGERYVEHGELLEMVEPERLVFSLTQEDAAGHVGPRTVVTVSFVERGPETTIMFRQTGYRSAKMRDGNAEGWGECFAKLAANVAAEKEIRALFEAWYVASSAKDLDATMESIAKDAISYEHEAPLEYLGADAIRAVCKRGFEAMRGDLRWDVPDLRVLVRGDVAVTWGVNHMCAQETGKAKIDLWSRGTRIFQKIDGRWLMIHQHVSFPMDPESGKAAMEVRPGWYRG
jgi:uncharacterized protein (TIGR02246 family)